MLNGKESGTVLYNSVPEFVWGGSIGEPHEKRQPGQPVTDLLKKCAKSSSSDSDPEVRVRFPALPDFLRSSGSGTGSTQPRGYN
jgi:hypothetical protein